MGQVIEETSALNFEKYLPPRKLWPDLLIPEGFKDLPYKFNLKENYCMNYYKDLREYLQMLEQKGKLIRMKSVIVGARRNCIQSRRFRLRAVRSRKKFTWGPISGLLTPK